MPARILDPWASGRRDAAPSVSGRAASGRVATLAPGHGHGVIRAGDTTVFFHRSDTDTPFNDLREGDVVKCQIVEDRVSGPRAIRVQRVGKTKSHASA